MYVYKKNLDSNGFTVGFFYPDGKFYPESDYPERSAAAEHVHYLNGGVNPELFQQTIDHLYAIVANINFLVEDLNQRLDHDKN